MSPVWVKQHQPRFVCSERSQREHRLQASIQQRGINNSNSEEKKWTKACKYVTRKVEVHKYLQIHDCIITTAPDIIHDINLRCKSCYLSKLCATKNLTTQIGFSPCLATNALKKWIEVCLWKPTYVQLSTRGRLHRTNLGWKSCDSTRADYFSSSSEIYLRLRNSAHELHNELLPPSLH